MIPEQLRMDTSVLSERGFDFEMISSGSKIYIRFKNFPLPTGLYNVDKTDLLIFTTSPYPNAGFDMFWTEPGLALQNGNTPKAAEAIEPHLGQDWRRFSYHPYDRTHWDPAEDNIGMFVEYVQQRLRRGD